MKQKIQKIKKVARYPAVEIENVQQAFHRKRSISLHDEFR